MVARRSSPGGAHPPAPRQIPDADFNTFYTPVQQNYALIDNRRVPIEEYQAKGKDRNSRFFPLPTGAELARMVREKLAIPDDE